MVESSERPSMLTAPRDLVPLGAGEIGGKAVGLMSVGRRLEQAFPIDRFPEIAVGIPPFTVIGTQAFDAFVSQNGLSRDAFDGQSDERVIHAVKRAALPPKIVGDLRRIASETRSPLAIRSSSLLEDKAAHPFAGVYGTKMVPGNSPSADARFQMLLDAVKFVYATAFFEGARQYAASVGVSLADEKMAVILQAVEGCARWDRFYPTLSGVARSVNFYPQPGARPEDGVVSLALGLGKTIVEGERSWTYCPAFPKAPPMYNSAADQLRRSQTHFYAVHMGKSPAYAPYNEDEYLVRADLAQAEYDRMLRYVASTYSGASDRIIPGIGREGPRVIDFGPILAFREIPLNDVIVSLVEICEETIDSPVEIEFAATLDPTRKGPARFSLLQVRPLSVNSETVDLPETLSERERLVAASDLVLGNGVYEDISEVVYIHPGRFNPKESVAAAREIARINQVMVLENRPYLLIVLGRLGTSDPWRGIPGEWGGFSGARVMVEVMTDDMMTDFSQGSHFFQNMTSAGVSFFSVADQGKGRIDWAWLEQLDVVAEQGAVRHARCSVPLRVMVDGRCNKGLILSHDR